MQIKIQHTSNTVNKGDDDANRQDLYHTAIPFQRTVIQMSNHWYHFMCCLCQNLFTVFTSEIICRLNCLANYISLFQQT